MNPYNRSSALIPFSGRLNLSANEERNKTLTTMETSKSKRGNKVYIDILRNAYGQTHVAPYSLRAKPGAPIATPIDWGELTSQLSPQKYRLENIFRQLANKKSTAEPGF
jgi:bifunctional non-homologous end joining protein LigD